MRYRAEPDARCQRGLTWRYRVEPALWATCERADARADLIRSLRHEAEVRQIERAYGDRRVVTLLRAFRYELRLWVRPGECTLLHRASAPPEVRAGDRRAFEQTLASWLSSTAAEEPR